MSRPPSHHRSPLITLVACFAVSLVGTSRLPAASTTYNLLPVTSGGYTLNGSITTDGATGNLSPQDILAWNWTATSATNTVSDNGSTLSTFPSAGLGASQSALYLNFPNAPPMGSTGSYLDFSSAIPYLEYDTATYIDTITFQPRYAEFTYLQITADESTYQQANFASSPGAFTIATTPEPSSLALLFTAVLGPSGVLLARRWRRATT